MSDKELNYKAEAEYLKIIEHMDRSEWSDAFIQCNELIKRHPDFSSAYFTLGWLFINKIGDFSKGLEMYNKCLELDLEIAKFTTNFIYLLTDLERYDELEKYLEKALDMPGMDKYIVYRQYGVLYELKKDFDKAKKYFKLAYENSLRGDSTEEYEQHIKRCDDKKELLKN